MATQVQFRRGTTTQNNAFTGAIGEITYDTEAKTLRLHDGSTAGGGSVLVTLAGTQTLTSKTLSTNSVWAGNSIGLAYGGTNASITAASGAVVYSTSSALGVSAAGTSGQVLTSGGTSAPVWVNASALSTGTAAVATTASNISGGSPGYLVYQQDTDDTAFIPPGVTGYFLRSTGATTAPDWVAPAWTIGSTEMTLGQTYTSIDGLTAIDATTGATSFFDTPTGDVELFYNAQTITIGADNTDNQVVFSSTNSIQIPVGTTAQRDGTPAAGQIRYNSEISSFEGYGPGGAWGSLGGVKDVDGDTYVLTEVSAGSDEDAFQFYNAGVNTMGLDGTALTLKNDTYIQFDTSATAEPASHSEGSLYYNNEYKALTYQNDVSGSSLQIGLEEWIRVYNNTGSTISNGTPLYVTGASGETPTVAPADATSLMKSQVIGVATNDIANGASGVATTRGLMSGLDTSGLTPGNRVHVGASGALQEAAPTYPYFPTDIGTCIVADASNGYIYVTINEHTFEQFRVTGNTRMDGNLTIDGDLTVSGTQTITSQANLALDNAFIYMNSGDTIGEANTTFTGSGLDDAYFGGHFEGTTTTSYYVRIDGVGTGTGGVDTFEWSKDDFSTTEATGVDLAATVSLDNNLTIKFNANTGHTSGDKWSGTAAPLNTDTGWASNRNTGASGVGYTHLGVIWDTAQSKFIVFDEYDPEIEGNVDTAHASFNYGSMRMAGLNATTGEFSSNATVGGTLTVTGGTTINSGLDVNGNLDVSGNISSSSGDISFGISNLSTTGTLASGALTVNGTLDSGALTVTGNTTISGDLQVNGGDITSSTGSISFGNENLSTTGTLSAGNITTGNQVLSSNGTAITGAYTVDASDDITLDAGGGDIFLKDDGTTYGAFTNSGGQLQIKTGSTPTTAVTFSSNGIATFNNNITTTAQINAGSLDVDNFLFDSNTLTMTGDFNVDASGGISLDAGVSQNITFKQNGFTKFLFNMTASQMNFYNPSKLSVSGDFTIDASGDIILDGDGADVILKDSTTTYGGFTNTSGNLTVKSGTTQALTFTGAEAAFYGGVTATGGVTGTYVNATNGLHINPSTINNTTSIGTGYNAMSAGPITIADGVTITVSTGASWTVV